MTIGHSDIVNSYGAVQSDRGISELQRKTAASIFPEDGDSRCHGKSGTHVPGGTVS